MDDSGIRTGIEFKRFEKNIQGAGNRTMEL